MRFLLVGCLLAVIVAPVAMGQTTSTTAAPTSTTSTPGATGAGEKPGAHPSAESPDKRMADLEKRVATLEGPRAAAFTAKRLQGIATNVKLLWTVAWFVLLLSLGVISLSFRMTTLRWANVSSALARLEAIRGVVQPPTVATVTPNVGPPAGGTPLTVFGANFRSTATLQIGGVAMPVTERSPNHLSGQLPAGTAGQAVPVRVTNPDGQWDEWTGFRYV